MSGQPPEVSVIIPAYRAAPCTGEALGSVLIQSNLGREAIVVSYSSSDTAEPAATLQPYLELILYSVQPHLAAAAARNTALRMAQGQRFIEPAGRLHAGAPGDRGRGDAIDRLDQQHHDIHRAPALRDRQQVRTRTPDIANHPNVAPGDVEAASGRGPELTGQELRFPGVFATGERNP